VRVARDLPDERCGRLGTQLDRQLNEKSDSGDEVTRRSVPSCVVTDTFHNRVIRVPDFGEEFLLADRSGRSF
jgi:hypothetical protein